MTHITEAAKKPIETDEASAPLFTVAILTYLQMHFLADCLGSILEQTYPNIEIVVCDDCSADFDIESVKRYIDENKGDNIKRVVVYKQEHNVGTVANAQKAVELSTGQYFKLHAGDDLLYDEKVLENVAHKLGNPSIDIVAARSIACLQSGEMTNDYYPSNEAFHSMEQASAATQFKMIATQSWGEYINAPAVFWKRNFFDQIAGFDLTYKYTEDWPMWVKITGLGYKITMIDDLTTIYRYGGISNDASTLNVTLGQIHYQECIRMLQEDVLPRFKKMQDTMAIFRCKHCIKCLETRAVSDVCWHNWNGSQRLAWKIKNLKFSVVSWMYRKKKYGVMIHKKGQLTVMAVSAVLYMFHVQVWPKTHSEKMWAAVFFVAAIWLFGKICMAKLVNLAGKMIDKKKGRGKK